MLRVPELVKKYYPELIWHIETEEKDLYLTFDDGPTPRVTEWVLDKLKEYNAKATFFCIGKNVLKYPALFERIKREGHSVGNHTHDHRKGWETKNFDYMKSVMKCHEIVNSDLFRPPYGRIKKAQIKTLKKRFRIIMWDVLSEDYNGKLNPEKCFRNVRKQSVNGSIIVFHDSFKAEKNMKECLKMALEFFRSEGYSFKPIK